MRHRSDQDQDDQAGERAAEGSTLIRRSPQAPPAPGRHRAPGVAPRLPLQKLPTHDVIREAPAPVRATPVVPARAAAQQEPRQPAVPLAAQWKASHLPRTLAATVLAASVAGTSGLGVRYAQTSSTDNLVSLVVGLAVVVVLWGVLIASTPQVVSLDGSVVTIHTLGGMERFDLADALQPVDLVGNPRTSHWAVLLHRGNGTTLVLRHNDVVATELDPIVRHYRMVANQRFAERQARFSR